MNTQAFSLQLTATCRWAERNSAVTLPGMVIEVKLSRMRESGTSGIYQRAALQSLRKEQTRALLPQLQRCAGTHGLLLSVDDAEPPALPLLPCWVHLRIAQFGYGGDVVAAADEPLPFLDDAFDLVWLRHALELAADPRASLLEAARVLAPGGTLVIAGLHPLSAWTPWLYWTARTQVRPRLLAPTTLLSQLHQVGLELISQRRVGAAWPRADGQLPSGRCGGGYLLLACKRRTALTPLRVKPTSLGMPSPARLASNASAGRDAL